MKEIRENLGNLECCLAYLQDANNLLEILMTGYFDHTVKYVKEKEWTLTLEYEKYQSLVNTLFIRLKDIEKDFDKNIYGIYDNLKENK